MILTDAELRALWERAVERYDFDPAPVPFSRVIERALVDKLIAECETKTKAAGRNSNMARGWGARAHWLRSKRGEGNGR